MIETVRPELEHTCHPMNARTSSVRLGGVIGLGSTRALGLVTGAALLAVLAASHRATAAPAPHEPRAETQGNSAARGQLTCAHPKVTCHDGNGKKLDCLPPDTSTCSADGFVWQRVVGCEQVPGPEERVYEVRECPPEKRESGPASIPGVPADATCKAQKKPAASSADPTQVVLNDAAGDRAIVAGCKARSAYLALEKLEHNDLDDSRRLLETQRAWATYAAERQYEAFPHLDEGRDFYGSEFPMLLAGFEEDDSAARAKELRAANVCKDGTSAGEGDKNAIAASNSALEKELSTLRKTHSGDAAFAKGLQRAEKAFIAYSNAQVAFISRGAGDGSACGARERARLNRARVEALEALSNWARP